MADFTEKDVERLIQLFTQSDLTVLRVTTPTSEFLLSRQTEAPPASSLAQPVAAAPLPAPAAAAPAAPAAPPTAAASTGTAVTAPVLGAFYHAPRPGQPPYISVGCKVEAGTTVGLIEAMKVYTAVSAGIAGTVVEIVAGDNAFVEYGETLMIIEPDPAAA